MGFSSYDCRGCGHPLLSGHATNPINAWMEETVVLFPDGDVVRGFYDGYQGVELEDWSTLLLYEIPGGSEWSTGADVWHGPCWEVCGDPPYIGPAENAEDQGYFFDDPTHDLPNPLTDPEVAERIRKRFRSKARNKRRVAVPRQSKRRPPSGNGGGIPDMVALEFVSGSSAKFWESNINGRTVWTRWGRIGTPGRSTQKDFPTVEAARKAYYKKVDEKLAKGYS